MENKFCLKSRKELDEIRKQKAKAKKQVNEISDKLVGRAGRKIDQQYYQAKGEEIEAADKLSRGTGDMGTLIKASQKADNKLARANRFWKLADKRKARKQVRESKMNEDESGYLNDDEIAGFYKDFNIKSINNLEKKSSVWNGDEHFYYTGDIVIEFPNADDDYDEFAHEETYDHFIAHKEDGTRVAFDNWYPDEVYDQLSSAITKAIRDKFPPEEKDVEGIMRVGKKGYIMYRNNKTGKYYIARSGKEKPAYGKTFDNEEDLLVWAGEVGLLESKMNEISDETVYSAVAKAHDKALKSMRKDPDKRNFLRDANKLNNIYNAGLRREWRKKGLKNPVGMSAKQLGKVWDKDYEPVKDEYERQLKKRNKIDAFGNEKNESKINEGAGSAVIFEFEKADFNIPRVEDNQVIAEVEDLTLASAYDRREAPNGGFIVFDLDQVKAATIKTYNENDRLVDEPELTVEDIADVKYVSVETMPNLSYSWGWSRIELPKDVVLTWDKYQANYYMPELEVIFTDKAGEEYRVNTVNVDGEYHISEDVYYAYQDLDSYEDEEYDESLTAKKALIKSKTILEEYGEYQGDLNFEEIARQLEYGNTYGSTTYGAKWGEVEINGTPISDLLKTNEVIEWVLYKLSYPVRDGHAYYNGLDLLFNNYSYEDTIDHTNEDVIADLVALGFDEDLIREMPVIKDPEYQGDISDERFKEIETWIDYDINYKEPEKDEEYDESLSKADKRLAVPNRPRLKSLADDIVDLGVETAKSVGHALTGDIFRKRRKPVKENFTASEALQESRKILGEISDETVRKVRNKRRDELNNWKDDEKYYWKEYRKARNKFDKIDANTTTFTQMNSREYQQAKQDFDYADRQWDNARTQLGKAHDKYKNFNRLDMGRYMRKHNASEALELSKKHLEERKTRSHRRKTMVIPFSFENPDQHSPADRINHKLIITKEQDGTFSWSETSNDESGKGFKSAKEAFDNAVSTGEFPLEDYDGFRLDAKVDLATFFNESKISKSISEDKGFHVGDKVKIKGKNDLTYEISDISRDEDGDKLFNLYNPKTDNIEEEPMYDYELEHTNESKMNEISDELADRVANARKLNAIGAADRYNKIDKEYDADLGKVIKKYSDEEVSAGKANKEFDKVIKKYEPLLDTERKTIRKAEKNQELMARRKTKTNESKINETIKGNNLNSKWVIRAWMDNMDSEDGYDEIEFTKIGLIDFINSEEEDYYGDSYDYQAEPIEYDITDEELKTAINDNVFAWVFGDTASVVSIDGKPVNESMYNKYGEDVDPKEWENKEARGLNEAKSNEVNIFLTNLGKYNEGELVGEWVELPVDDFQPILDRIGINDEYEEWFITDYEAPFEINEYDNIEELNDIAREIQDFDSTQLEVLNAYKEHGYDMRDAIDKVIDNDYIYLEGDTEEDLAYSYIDMAGSFEDAVSKEDKQYYFDYEAYGRDLVLGGDYSESYDDEDNFLGYEDYEGNIVDVSSEKELGEYVIDDIFGGVDQLGDEEIERYFDYAWWGKTLSYDFYKTDNGWVQLD